MKEEKDYIRDIAEMRSMMERSTKFFSLSGLSAVILGVYALAAAFVAYKFFAFYPDRADYEWEGDGWRWMVLAAAALLFLALGTAVLLSLGKARAHGEKVWNPTARRLVLNMAVPLVAGGLLALIFISQGLAGLAAPCTLVFYGLAQYNASKFTYGEVRGLGLLEIALGLAGFYFVEYSLICWAAGFGLLHIIYGLYLHFTYER